MEKETGAGTASTDLSQTNSGSTEQASAGCCPIYGSRPQVRGRGRPSGCAPPRAQVRGCAELCAGGAEGAQWSPAEAPALPFVPLPAIGAGRQSGDPAGNWGCGAVRATERVEPNWELGGVGGHCALWLPRGCAPGWRAPGWHKKVPPASGQSDPFGAKDGAAGAARGSGEILQTPQNSDQKRCSPFSLWVLPLCPLQPHSVDLMC